MHKDESKYIEYQNKYPAYLKRSSFYPICDRYSRVSGHHYRVEKTYWEDGQSAEDRDFALLFELTVNYSTIALCNIELVVVELTSATVTPHSMLLLSQLSQVFAFRGITLYAEMAVEQINQFKKEDLIALRNNNVQIVVNVHLGKAFPMNLLQENLLSGIRLNWSVLARTERDLKVKSFIAAIDKLSRGFNLRSFVHQVSCSLAASRAVHLGFNYQVGPYHM